MKVDSIGVKLGKTIFVIFLSYFVFFEYLFSGRIGSFIKDFVSEIRRIWVNGGEYEL